MKTLVCVVTLLMAGLSGKLGAQSPAFTYQGRLNDGGNPAQGIYDLRFSVYDAQAGGNAVGGPLTNAVTAVAGGLFTAVLDFGGGAFDGSARWLDIAVRPSGSTIDFRTLEPRPPPWSDHNKQVMRNVLSIFQPFKSGYGSIFALQN